MAVVRNYHEEISGAWVYTFSKNLSSLYFRNALDLLEDPAWCISHGLDGVVASVDDLLNVALRDAIEALKKKDVSATSLSEQS